MRLTHLHLENFRGFRRLSLSLDRPLTVLVGTNGSGKTSVLDALVIAIGALYSVAYDTTSQELEPKMFDESQLREGAFHGMVGASYVHNEYSSDVAVRTTRDTPEIEIETPEEDNNTFFHERNLAMSPPLCVFRSAIARDDDAVTQSSIKGKKLYTQAFRALRNALGGGSGLGHTIRFLKSLVENPPALTGPHRNRMRAVQRACISLLGPGYTWATYSQKRDTLHIAKKSNSVTIDQLSAGERCLLALGADIARRLWWANPTLENPLLGEAVVMVDEIELHLHPRWQRRILERLRRTFPNCQFIVTTHSPQVVASAPNSSLVVLSRFKITSAKSPTFGKDSNSILESTMGSSARPIKFTKMINDIEKHIDREDIQGAKTLLSTLRTAADGEDKDVQRLAAIIRVLE